MSRESREKRREERREHRRRHRVERRANREKEREPFETRVIKPPTPKPKPEIPWLGIVLRILLWPLELMVRLRRGGR